MNQKIRTRFAPSPTGYLHIGGLRTALYAFLFAKKHKGEFLLRIEDTDQERLVEGATQNFIDTLHWAGIDIDVGPGKEDDKGPYVQSERLPIYREYALKLIESGHAYRCFCTKERLDQLREEQMATKQAPMYDRKCRYLSEEEIQVKINAGESYVIRQAIPLNERVKFEDIIRGKLNFDTNTLDDQVLLKSDGFPTYQLANVVDDHLMEITHVIRGEEWIPSAPKNVLLYQAFGWEPPVYAHLPLILNKDRSKLSKRQNDVSTQSYIEKGYIKEALVNFIALLGWNSSDNQEIFSLDELIQAFELERVQKSGAIFDIDKLNWFNWQWKRRKHLYQLKSIAEDLDPDVEITEPKKGHLSFTFKSELIEQNFTRQRAQLLKEFAKDYLIAEILKEEENDLDFFSRAMVAIEEKILKEPENTTENIHFFFKNELDYNKDFFLHEKMKIDTELAKKAIQTAIDSIQKEDFKDQDTLKQKFVQIIANLGLKNGQVLWPVRVALTNEEFSPGVWELGCAYGYEKTVKRLKGALTALST